VPLAQSAALWCSTTEASRPVHQQQVLNVCIDWRWSADIALRQQHVAMAGLLVLHCYRNMPQGVVAAAAAHCIGLAGVECLV
jgi:hypothetical protein